MLLQGNLDMSFNFLNQKFLGEEVSSYLWFAGIILATLFLDKVVTNLLAGSGNIIARFFNPGVNNRYKLGVLIRKPLARLVQVVLYYTAVSQLSTLFWHVSWKPFMGKKGDVIHLDRVIDHLFLFLFILFIGQLISKIIDFIYHVQLDRAREENNKERVQLLPLVKEMGKLLMWSVCLFWVLGSVFHVNIPALVTGLGIGGVAIALAAKESVENFFAALTILSDKPFQIGDTVRINNIEGVVERIGFRSTRIRSGDGAAHIVPNQKLVNENLINLSMRDNRVVKIAVSIKYGVPHANLVKMIEELKKMLHATKYVREPIDALLENFGKDTFQLNVSYSLPFPLPDGSSLDRIKQEINMRIYDIVSQYAAFYINTQPEPPAEDDEDNKVSE